MSGVGVSSICCGAPADAATDECGTQGGNRGSYGWRASAKSASNQRPEANGGKSMEQVVEHMAEDTFVGWGWAPGAEREPAPRRQGSGRDRGRYSCRDRQRTIAVPETANVCAILRGAGSGGQSLTGDCSWTSREACCRVPHEVPGNLFDVTAPMATSGLLWFDQRTRGAYPSGLNMRGSGRTRKFTTAMSFAPRSGPSRLCCNARRMRHSRCGTAMETLV